MTETPKSETDRNVWRSGDLEEALAALVELYGSSAVTAAAHCAFSAHYDGRSEDFRFWFDAFMRLQQSTAIRQ
jgi:hypothetical protein